MNLYNKEDDQDTCVATNLEQRFKMFLAEGFSPVEAVREAKEIIKFEWLIDQGRDPDQAGQLVQMPLRSMMMTTFSQKPADSGYPARMQWLLDRGLYSLEEATRLAYQTFDILVVMHDEVELAAGRQHCIWDYFSGNRRNNVPPKRKPSFHPQFGEVAGPPVAKVAAVKPWFRQAVVPQVFQAPPWPNPAFSNLDRFLSAPEPTSVVEAPVVTNPAPAVIPEPTPSCSKIVPQKEVTHVVTKKAKIAPTAKPAFKWSWTSSGRANLSTVPAAFGQEDEEEPPTKSAPEVQAKIVPDIPKVFNVPPPPLPVPPPSGSNVLDPALLAQPIFQWAGPISSIPLPVGKPVIIPELPIEPPPLPPDEEIPKPPEPEPEPVFKIATITTGSTKPAANPPNRDQLTWVNPALSRKPEAPLTKPAEVVKPKPLPQEVPRPIPSLAKPTTTTSDCDIPRPIPSLAAPNPANAAKIAPKATVGGAPQLKWSSTIPTISTRGSNIVITPTARQPEVEVANWSRPVRAPVSEHPPQQSAPNDEFSSNWDKAWGVDESSSRWASFRPDGEEDPSNPYGVPMVNKPRETVATSSAPARSSSKVDDLYAMLNR